MHPVCPTHITLYSIFKWEATKLNSAFLLAVNEIRDCMPLGWLAACREWSCSKNWKEKNWERQNYGWKVTFISHKRSAIQKLHEDTIISISACKPFPYFVVDYLFSLQTHAGRALWSASRSVQTHYSSWFGLIKIHRRGCNFVQNSFHDQSFVWNWYNQLFVDPDTCYCKLNSSRRCKLESLWKCYGWDPILRRGLWRLSIRAIFHHYTYSKLKLRFEIVLFKCLLNCMTHHLNRLTWHFNISAEMVVQYYGLTHTGKNIGVAGGNINPNITLRAEVKSWNLILCNKLKKKNFLGLPLNIWNYCNFERKSHCLAFQAYAWHWLEGR